MLFTRNQFFLSQIITWWLFASRARTRQWNRACRNFFQEKPKPSIWSLNSAKLMHYCIKDRFPELWHDHVMKWMVDLSLAMEWITTRKRDLNCNYSTTGKVQLLMKMSSRKFFHLKKNRENQIGPRRRGQVEMPLGILITNRQCILHVFYSGFMNGLCVNLWRPTGNPTHSTMVY